jgi:hypothetical protein
MRLGVAVHHWTGVKIRLSCLPLLAIGMFCLSMPRPAVAGMGVSVRIAPPELPFVAQPVCPGDGYLWTPEYWAWEGGGYYLVPGAWVMAPEAGYLWTPGYWGWGDGGYFFNEGYWGESVGFYGGIDYGFGYFGNGYEGGRWDRGHFFYNRSVNHLNSRTMRNVYDGRGDERSGSRVSYNGGAGGVNARATSEQEAAASGRHIPGVAAQTQRASEARSDHAAVHPKELAPVGRSAAPNSGNARTDQRYQKQQDQLVARQSQERQGLQRQQDREHRQMARQSANADRSNQMEQRHQQQTHQMQQRQSSEMGHMEMRQSGGGGSRGGGGGRH